MSWVVWTSFFLFLRQVWTDNIETSVSDLRQRIIFKRQKIILGDHTYFGRFYISLDMMSSPGFKMPVYSPALSSGAWIAKAPWPHIWYYCARKKWLVRRSRLSVFALFRLPWFTYTSTLNLDSIADSVAIQFHPIRGVKEAGSLDQSVFRILY